MKRFVCLAIACALLTLCACAPLANETTPPPTEAPATPSPTSEATPEPTPEAAQPTPAQEREITGAVVSAAENAVCIKTADGRQLEFITTGADTSDAPDIVAGCTLSVVYAGDIAGQDASGALVLKLAQDPLEKHASGTIALFDGREISLKLDGEQYLRFSIEGVDLSLATNLAVGQKATVVYTGEGEERTIVRVAQ